jgi:hypothetical protein
MPHPENGLSHDMKKVIPGLLFPLLGIAVTCIHFSPALSSVFLALVLILSLVCFKQSGKAAPLWSWFLPALFVWQLTAQLMVGWQQGAADKILLKLPLFFVPFLIAWAGRDEAGKHRLTTLLGVNLVHFWIALASVFHYLAHFKFYNQMILESKPIPLFTQVYHIEFSLMLAVFALAGILHRRQRGHFVSEMLFWLSMVNLILVFMISVRTGMLGVLCGLGLKLFWDMRENKRSRWLLTGLFVLAALAFLLVPALKNRLINTIDDVKTIASAGDVSEKSLGRRWVAWNAAIIASVDAPLCGFGMKGVEDALGRGYEKQGNILEESNRVMPHNEFLDLLLQSGWPAFILLLIVAIYMLLNLVKTSNGAGLAVWAALFSAACFESYLERQAGVLLFVAACVLVLTAEKREIIA